MIEIDVTIIGDRVAHLRRNPDGRGQHDYDQCDHQSGTEGEHPGPLQDCSRAIAR